MLLENAGDYTIREFSYGVQNATAVVCRIFEIHIACEIIVVTNPIQSIYYL